MNPKMLQATVNGRLEILSSDTAITQTVANRRKGKVACSGAKSNRQFKDPELLSAEKVRDLVQRVADSQMFHRAVALRKFLLYVVEHAISGDVGNLKEQPIGVHALRRPWNYDPRLDNIVRVRAVELRRRLEEYFSSVGDQEPIVIKIPRGTYVPEFLCRSAEVRLISSAEEQRSNLEYLKAKDEETLPTLQSEVEPRR